MLRKIFAIFISRIVGKSPVYDLICQNIVLGPPFHFEPPVLSRGGSGSRNSIYQSISIKPFKQTKSMSVSKAMIALKKSLINIFFLAICLISIYTKIISRKNKNQCLLGNKL